MCNPVTTESPDVLLIKGLHLGFEWEVTSNRMGYRCGYVRIPPDHPWHGKDYDEVKTAGGDYVDVHGGLTFAQPDADCGKRSCPGVPHVGHASSDWTCPFEKTGGEDNAWWLGFDCAHHMDAPDPELPGYDPRMASLLGRYGSIKTTPYVVAECRRLAEQALRRWEQEAGVLEV